MVAAGVAALATLAAAAGFQPPEPTLAAWSRTSYVSAPLTAGVVNPVTSLSCAAGFGALGGGIRFNWKEPSTDGYGLKPTSYTLKWSGTAGTDEVSDIQGLSGIIPGSALSLLGSSRVVVHAKYGNWESAVSTETRTFTTISIAGFLVNWNCN